MKPQTGLSKKRILIYSISFTVMVISMYYLLLPIDRKLQLFCVLDDAHLAKEQPVWQPGYWRTQYTEWVDGYWTCPRSGSNLTMTGIQEAIDSGMWVAHCNTDDIFWIGQQQGPLKAAFYGPYQGNLWKLTNAINPIALIGIALSTIALLHPLIHRLLTKTYARARVTTTKNNIAILTLTTLKRHHDDETRNITTK